MRFNFHILFVLEVIIFYLILLEFICFFLTLVLKPSQTLGFYSSRSCQITSVPILFNSQEEADTRLGVQEALSMMAPAFRQADDSTLALLEALILSNVEKVSIS